MECGGLTPLFPCDKYDGRAKAVLGRRIPKCRSAGVKPGRCMGRMCVATRGCARNWCVLQKNNIASIRSVNGFGHGSVWLLRRGQTPFPKAKKGTDPAPNRTMPFSGGEAGIRTRGAGYSPLSGLAIRRFRPLSHLSGGIAPRENHIRIRSPVKRSTGCVSRSFGNAGASVALTYYIITSCKNWPNFRRFALAPS